MTAWDPDVGASGRQSANVIQTQLHHNRERTPVQWVSNLFPVILLSSPVTQ